MTAFPILKVSCGFLVSIAVLLTQGLPAATANTRPNIVFILADDLGYGDLGCYGRKDIQTPKLDAMAASGVRFTAHYANGPECSPTRAAFLTGRYQQWVGGLECAIGTGNVGRYDDAIRLRETNDLGLPVTVPTLPRVLKDAGYETALFGKWHLGYEPKFAPKHHGFDHSYYCIGGEMDYFHFTDNVAGYNLFEDGQPIRDDGYFTDLMTDKAVDFIAAERDRPYFLYLPYTCPHSPFQGPNDRRPHPLPLDSKLWKQGIAPPDVYIQMIEHMDARIGDVLDAVDENTLVVFASDNGGTKSARNTPYRGIKGSTFEGGIRVPAIAWWPKELPAGKVCDTPTLTFDWTKTFADAAGAEFPQEHSLEGMNVFSILDGEAIDRTLYWRKPRGTQIWKGVRDGNWKYIADRKGGKEREYLFDLSTDEGETTNLLESHRTEATQLRAQFDRWEEKTRRNRRGRPLIGWRSEAPREEIRPRFHQTDADELVITADEREGLMGWWCKDFGVTPGQAYRFQADCRVDSTSNAVRQVVARVVWLNELGRNATRSPGDRVRTRREGVAKAEPEFPTQRRLADGMLRFADEYLAPPDALIARVELHLRWATPHSHVCWSNIELCPISDVAKRTVKLAAVHYRPETGITNREKCAQFEPLIEAAGKEAVDLLVLPETLTYYRSGRDMVDCAEPIPGPSTNYFSQLAKKHHLHLVVGLLERGKHLVYNVAVLIGPGGELIGKYRKVSLPRGEIEAGLSPGHELPVFETSLGRVGMMICYDGFFPEVAKGLTEKGAEVIAWPVWGCNPLLAQARACENHVYLISSTYTSSRDNWLLSAVYGHDGQVIANADKFGTLAIAEVDLDRRLHWQSLGDFKAQLPAHRPVIE
ncbi:MAG: sulfatase-like hydrolase/transferase [Planctomycetota bacterium]